MRRLASLLSVAALIALSIVVVLLAFGLPLQESVNLIAGGAFGSSVGIARSLVKATPLLLTGLGMTVAWKAGMYNIGGEGQFIVGGLAGATLFKLAPTMAPAMLNPAILLSAIVAGACFATLAGWLHLRRGVHVVISTILLNFVALQMLDWAVSGPLQESKKQLPLTDRLPDAAMMLRLDPKTDLHTGLYLAVAATLLIYAFLYATRSGFALRLVGENARAARANRVRPEAVQMVAMALSGGLCGLAAGVEYTGLAGQIGTGFSQNWGFLAIPVALLGGLHPLGVLASALAMGTLFAGTENLGRYTPAGSTILYVIQAVAVLAFVAIGWGDRRAPRPQESST